MKRLVQRKRVKVLDSVMIYPLGIQGPIDKPALLKIDQICELVMSGYQVTEVLDDGSEIKLDASNYDVDHGEGSIINTYEANFGIGHKNDKKVETIPAPADENALAKLLQASTIPEKHPTKTAENGATKTQINTDSDSYSSKKKQKAEKFASK